MISYDPTTNPRCPVTFQQEHGGLDVHRNMLDVAHWLDADGKVHARLNHQGHELPPNAQRAGFTLAYMLELLLSTMYPPEAFQPPGHLSRPLAVEVALNVLLGDLHAWSVASHPIVAAAIEEACAADEPDLEGLRALGERVRDNMRVFPIEGAL